MEIELSIIICTYNREDYLPLTLESLATQSLDKNRFEVIIVDNNSTDKTSSYCHTFIEHHPGMIVKYILEKNRGLPFARNRGIKESSGSYIAFIDDDAEARKDYAANLIRVFEKYTEYEAVGGKVIPVFPENKEPPWLSSYIWGVVAKVDKGDQYSSFKRKVPAGCNMAFRKKVFSIIGDFDTDLSHRCDDLYIFGKLKAINKVALYSPDVVVYHNIPPERMDKEGIKKLSMNLGASHRIFLRNKPFYSRVIKFLDYVFKICAAIVLSIGFLLKAEPTKTKIVVIMWYSLVGFLRVKSSEIPVSV
ncbi:MAG: glycosyltransferase family 2 protein [Bacteroidales bacterium]|nr:MAG: glycosyltransferase family 2 protein [Bacteroidales bacterium]